MRELFDRYAQAWAARDPDLIIALHTPDTRFWLHSGATPVCGRAEVRDAFAGMFLQWPEFGFDVHRVLLGEDHWVLDWALTAVLAGQRPVRFDCLDVVTVDERGLVARKDTYVDYPQVTAALTP